MRRLAPASILLLALLTVAVPASAQDLAPRDARSARVVQPAPGGILTSPSTAPRGTIIAEFLQSRGSDARTAASLRVGTERGDATTGLTHVTLEQEADGLRVYGSYVKATFSARGELVHLIENLAAISPAGVLRANVDTGQALRAALRELYPNNTFNPTPAGRSGSETTFTAGAFFYRNPTVTAVALPMTDNVLRGGYVVETWSREGNQLHHTVVGGDGRVLAVEARTSQDSYRVFPEDPEKDVNQTVVNGPTPNPGNLVSPFGWLNSGSHTTINISGNNVRAYRDADNNNAADGGGSSVSDGDFLTLADLTAQPTTTANQAVAVQNLFYLNNYIHDRLYRYGFNEAAGNFQANNNGQGGAANDPVNAEAQDGGGTDNANFATPTDGQAPRMQMYLWVGKGDHQVLSGPNTYLAAGASFGPALTTTGLAGTFKVAVDSTAPTGDACSTIAAGQLTGVIAIVDRGSCDFVVKVRNVQAAGAIGVVVANNAGNDYFTMGGTDRKIRIPAVMIGQSDGATLKGALGNGTIRKNPITPLQRDGSVDADIVFHEYCHGLTWRMIGSMSGAISGAVGEGMSDVCAILVNGDDRVGEYSSSTPLGIRRAPYTGYPNTYGNFGGTSVHADGEIYAAIGWKLKEDFGDARIDDLFEYLVQGMEYTPAGPYYEDMRDGILTAITRKGASTAAQDTCLVWKAFAHYGVGENAQATLSFKRGKIIVSITESFVVPASCQ